MEDIEFKTDAKKFKYRVNGIIIHNNKILTIKMKNNISYCLQSFKSKKVSKVSGLKGKNQLSNIEPKKA